MTAVSTRLFTTACAGAALVATMAGCSSNSTSSSPTTTSVSATTTTSTPTDMATPMDSTSAMDSAMPMDSASATDSSSASTTPSAAASTPVASATASTPAAGGSFTGHKDATVTTKLVPVASMKFASVKFPKTLGGMPMLGDLDGGQASRYASYTKLDNPLSITTTVAKNTDANDTDLLANQLQGAASYDGGRIKCGMNETSNSHTCMVRIAGNDDFVTSTTSAITNDALVKYTVEFLNHQK